MLEDYGIPVNQYQHASIFDLTAELAQGHMVMIGVNSIELHHPPLDDIAEALHVGTADHVVIVSGIDTHDPEHVQVSVSDPESGQTVARYPLESFVNAWSDSNFFVAATKEPPPQVLHSPEMKHFGYESEHVEEIAGLPYDEFLHDSDFPEDVEHVLEEYLESHAEHLDRVPSEPDKSVAGTHAAISEADVPISSEFEHDGEHNGDNAGDFIHDESGYNLEHNSHDLGAVMSLLTKVT